MGKLSLIGNDDKMWQKAFCIINLYFFLSVFPMSFVPIQAGSNQEGCVKRYLAFIVKTLSSLRIAKLKVRAHTQQLEEIYLGKSWERVGKRKTKLHCSAC